MKAIRIILAAMVAVVGLGLASPASAYWDRDDGYYMHRHHHYWHPRYRHYGYGYGYGYTYVPPRVIVVPPRVYETW